LHQPSPARPFYKSGAEQRRINDAVIAEIVLPGFV